MSTSDIFLAEACAIADRLTREAHHFRDRATWLTRSVPYRQTGSNSSEVRPELTPLNPSVYSGTAGVALLYARLHRFTNERTHARMARAALNHALHNAWFKNDTSVGSLGDDWRFGFYLGTLGIAWTAHELSRLLDEPFYAREARRLLRALAATVEAPHQDDLMFGNAGAIPALIALDADSVPGARELACILGDELLERAEREEDGRLSWRHTKNASKHNLTGYSHGTAGMAAALVSLYALTGEPRYLEGAEGAFAYERAAFDEAEGNWPNYQSPHGRDGRYPCSTAWCHGAPGIGVSRVVSYALLKDLRLLEEIRIAQRTTHKQVRQELTSPGLDHMLCHGVAGNLECLWLMEEALGDQTSLARMREIARYTIELYGAQARERWGREIEWPTGVPRGIYPPLITGIAGVAHWLLRLHAPDRVPTVLAPGRGMPL